MADKICCPKCGSAEVRCVDSLPLHPDKNSVKLGNQRYDTEVYMSFKCDACKVKFDKVFTLILKR